MKLIIVLLFAFIGMNAAFAQNPLDKVAKDAKTVSTDATKAATNSFDVSSISTEVVNSLTKNLRLTKDQKPAVTSLVNDLLNKKKDILPTAATNKKDYDAKMTSIRNLFPEKMKKLISADQMKLLTALIPKSNTTSNVLSKMLY
ncbi:hypothetical protein [Flavobacterium sp.]|uniref:hypothetical protein n=1 Tax=Flavobacterium sp. TaxID=239 RepID=UPI0025C4C372|nr:hypothetical protein [Flavobacterium sp.]MBA4153585.1 hypothetical protein [Flavobacterium sp.]